MPWIASVPAAGGSWYTATIYRRPGLGCKLALLGSKITKGTWSSGLPPVNVRNVGGVGEKAFLVVLKPPSDPHLIAAKGDIAVKVTTRNLELAREAARAVLAKL